jgi:septum formation protein
MLENAGVPVQCHASGVDEDQLKTLALAEAWSGEQLALALAERKAKAAAVAHPGRVIVGADQILECDGVRYDKPRSLDEARSQLESLRGRSHRLISGAVILRDSQVIARPLDSALLTMRAFTDDFLDAYLKAVGPVLLSTVGGYRIEERGLQLFDQVSGDHFVILGLPLLPILAVLRQLGVLQS